MDWLVFHDYEDSVEIYVVDFKFQLGSFQLPISNHDLEVGCWTLFYN